MAFHYFEFEALDLLKIGDDLEEVTDGRVALGAEHAHEGLGVAAESFAESYKTEGAVDVIAQHGLAGFDIPCDHAMKTFTKVLPSEWCALLNSFPDFVVQVFGE